MNIAHVIGALAFCAAALQASACDLPSIPLIPAKEDIGDRAEQVRAEAGVYFTGMRAYATCVQSQLNAAGGDAAPASVKTVLVARNNAAVQEALEIQQLFEERVGGGQAATPGTDAAVRKLAEGIISGEPDYAAMTPEMAAATEQQLGNLRRGLTALGSVIRSVDFAGVDPQGHDVYLLRHEKGTSRWLIGLDGEGKINFALMRPANSDR